MYDCKEHSIKILNCLKCFSAIKSSVYLSVENTDLKRKIKSIFSLNEELSRTKNSIQESLNTIKSKLYLKSSVIPKSSLQSARYIKYIENINLPRNILTIVYNQELALSFLYQKKFLNPVKECECGQLFDLAPHHKSFILTCSCGKRCRVTKGTIWDFAELTVGKIVFILFSWTMNLSNSTIATLTQVERRVIRLVTKQIREIVSSHFMKKLPQFKGVVEIDESCFRSTVSKPGLPAADKWVFGIYERERKLIYMEMVSKRTALVLLPIIQKICEVGTTVISDQWSAYQKLTDLGFPHFVVDHSRFFVNPKSREIHTQNIEISWCWAKHWIKKHRKVINFQDHLNTFCWARQFRTGNKKNEIAFMMNELAGLIFEHHSLSQEQKADEF